MSGQAERCRVLALEVKTHGFSQIAQGFVERMALGHDGYFHTLDDVGVTAPEDHGVNCVPHRGIVPQTRRTRTRTPTPERHENFVSPASDSTEVVPLMWVVLGGVYAATARDVRANPIGVQMREGVDNLADVERPFASLGADPKAACSTSSWTGV